jgi:hypothetical protein
MTEIFLDVEMYLSKRLDRVFVDNTTQLLPVKKTLKIDNEEKIIAGTGRRGPLPET